MFYSQFILAKKGPLGTIWIAAHLERKLRKNQVADTDIGVSVDSILFPEVPIALRLSSHLLLGVVRIYSRKVNYLFHDCSEALLKIKQAFRSTAVDLPPEESTAPYHSITLPETFDLDDFELPDTAFNGNFVDHHVSTREQITLQDPMEGTAYSTSQFGLDERFGDGDASQIRLDLDEELFLDKNLSPQHASLGSEERAVHHNELSRHLTNMDVDQDLDGCTGNRNAETLHGLSKVLSGRDKDIAMDDLDRNDDSSQRLMFNIRTPDLNEVFLPSNHMEVPSPFPDIGVGFGADEPSSPYFIESAHFPSTPGLLDEAIPVNVQELPALNTQRKMSPSTTTEANATDNSTALLESECAGPTDNNVLVHPVPMDLKSINIGQVASSPTSVLTELKPGSAAPQSSGVSTAAPDATDSNGPTETHTISSVQTEQQPNSLALQSSGGISGTLDVVTFESTPESADKPHFGSICNKEDNLPVSGQMHDNRDTIIPEAAVLDNILSNSCSHEASNLETPLANCVAGPNGVVVATDSILVSGMPSDSNVTLLEDGTALNLSKEGHLEDARSRLTTSVSALSSEFHLRSCNSHSNQNSGLSVVDMILPENVPGFSSTEPHCTSEIPVGEEASIGRPLIEMQGEDSRSAILTNNDVGVHQNSNHVSSELAKDTQLDHLNCFSSSEFSAPEKMLAPTSDVNLPNDLGQHTIEKAITESDGSVDRASSHGQKRRLMDSTPVLQNGTSSKMSGVPRARRNSEYIPDDDDLLASILVGRRTPAFRMGPTPPLLKPASLKRPRLTPKVGIPKRRKVLLDDTMVLHADAIRQQLINTEDIRRLRKKAPCNRPEIWWILKISVEDDIFSESIFTGVSAELNTLQLQRYDRNGNPGSSINKHQFNEALSNEIELSRSLEFELSRNLDFVRETGDQQISEQISVVPNKVDGEIKEPSASSVLIEPQTCSNAQEHLNSLLEPQLNISGNNQKCTVATTEVDAAETAGVELPIHAISHVGIECQIQTDSRNEETSLHESNKMDESQACDAICNNSEQQRLGVDLITERACVDSSTIAEDAAGGSMVDDTPAVVSGETSLCTKDACNVKDVLETEHPVDVEMVDALVGEPVPEEALVDVGRPTSEGVSVDEGRVVSELICSERPEASSSPVQANIENELVPSTVGENSCMQDFNLDSGLDVESNPTDFMAARESSDFCSAIDGNDTEFLNVDEEADYDEEADNDVPNPEEAQSLENSGWSSRTRGVARYLKALFDEESGRGRKIVAIDHLLAGKTRKEASRMFFETLVLKTKDYIHVEQENSFDYVKIKPRIKLLKSEF